MPHVSEILAERARDVILTPEEKTRYSRHLLLPEVGIEGQRRLKSARVLVVGAGGLGSPVSLYLAAAGVGTIGVVEFDTVDSSNLQRQVLYGEDDAGTSKLDAAVRRLTSLNSFIEIVPHAERLTPDNAFRLFTPYDIIVDGTDNFPTRYLANDACVLLGKPYVYGSIFRFDGQASVFYPPRGPCYRCLFPAPPPAGLVPSCAEGGVLGVLPAQIGSVQANETLKLILGIGRTLLGRLLTLDALDMRVDEFRIERNSACAVCGDKPTITSLALSVAACELPVAQATERGREMTPNELQDLKDRAVPHRLLDVRSESEAAICKIEGSVLIPLPELENRLSELSKSEHLVVYCRSGARSAKAAEMLTAKGFEHVANLNGGILAWIDAFQLNWPKY